MHDMIDTNKTRTEFLQILKKTKSAILPFTECPAVNKSDKSHEKISINATELFSIFTADIIKEEVIFMR